MARTRGASQIAGLQHMDDGIITPHVPAVAAPPPPPPAPGRYVFNKHTAERTMEASELVAILDMVMGGLSHEIDREEWVRMNPNLRRHFRAEQ